MTCVKTAPILVAGCPRSGTTWLHFLIATHPDTVTVRETHVYDKYVGPIYEWYQREGTFEASDGLSGLFSEKEFIANVLAPIVLAVFGKIQELGGSNKTVVEKTPGNMLHHRLINEIQPDAKMIFISRDPRAVFASYRAASSYDWGKWTKKTVPEFCESWNKYAIAYLSAKQYWSKERLKIIKYEDLKRRGEEVLGSVFAWSGLREIDGLARKALEENEIEKLKLVGSDSLKYETRRNFYRSGRAYGWVKELSVDEITAIERQCGDLMSIMGYAMHKRGAT